MTPLPRLTTRALARAVRSTPLHRTELLLELDLSRGLLEAPPASPAGLVRGFGKPTLRDVIAAIEKAADDDRVRGLVAHIGAWQPGLARSYELRRAVTRLRASGRRTIAWSESFGELGPGNTGYHLASAFEQVWLQPSGQVGLVGLTAEAVFLRGSLDKLGVEPQVSQRYEYKTAADTFVAEGMTEAHREMLGRLVESGMETLVGDVAGSRGLTVDQVRAAVDVAPLSATEAVERGLVDRLGYRHDVYAAAREGLEDVDLLFVERYGRSRRAGLPNLGQRPTVAVVAASGAIRLGRSGGPPMSGRSIGSDTLGAALRAAGRDESVRAVVLRLDTPGGSYVASDTLRQEVLALRGTGTTVVASMGAVAASGGYFVAMPCEKVVATPGTLTGSIGVLAGKQVLAPALARVGIRRERVVAGRYADMFSSDRPFDDQEWGRLEAWLDAVYADFTAKAAQDRGMDVDRLRSLARGRVWTGADAVEHGLVDQTGGLTDAVDVACLLAGLDRSQAQVRPYPHVNPLQRLVPAQNSESPTQASEATPGPAHGLGSVLAASVGPGPLPGLVSGLAGLGVEGVPWVDQLLAAVGMPYGALSLPWRLTIH
ncbi:MAG TPA: S49 family peptidase [Nocardioidaceae bacterium]|nr:S49 family peptidase [Nocardioidaceae bacterium]